MLILTGRNLERLQRAAGELEAQSIAAFDADDPAALERFFGDLPGPIDPASRSPAPTVSTACIVYLQSTVLLPLTIVSLLYDHAFHAVCPAVFPLFTAAPSGRDSLS